MRQVAAIMGLAALAGCSGGDSGAVPEPSASSAQALPARLLAAGSDPFWSAKIRPGRIDFSLADPNNSRRIDVTRTAVGDGAALRGTVDGVPVRAQIKPGDCRDGMSDRAYAYTIELRLGAEIFEGCVRADDSVKPVS